MEMNHWEWEGMDWKRHFRSSPLQLYDDHIDAKKYCGNEYAYDKLNSNDNCIQKKKIEIKDAPVICVSYMRQYVYTRIACMYSDACARV